MLLLALGLCAQLLWHFTLPSESPSAENLPAPPSLATLQLSSFGEPIAYSKLLLLFLQSYDNQPGISTPFRQLDYDRLSTWLNLTLELDPPGQYPLFLAAEVYGETGDQTKQRVMYDFIYKQFFIAPNQRWHSLAIAAIMTKHHLNDQALAEKYAQALRFYATGSNVPDWAKQMDIFMLEDMGDYASALNLLNDLLQSGQISDKHEIPFLEARRDSIAARLKNAQ